MVSASSIEKKVRRAIRKVGVQAALIDPNGVYEVSGMVAEGPTSTEVWCTPLLDESKRWVDPSITATVYIESTGPVRPRPGFRLQIGDRTFAVVAAFAFSFTDMTVSWRLDVGEVAP